MACLILKGPFRQQPTYGKIKFSLWHSFVLKIFSFVLNYIFSCDFRYPISPINRFENLFSIFSAAIFIQFPPSQSQDPQIRNIVSSSNIVENVKFSKMLGEKEWMTKTAAEKIKNYTVGRLFFDIYRHLSKPDDKAD